MDRLNSLVLVLAMSIAAGKATAALPALGVQEPATMTAAEARQIIADGNKEWGRARVALDKATFERMLAADFFVQLQDRKLTREEFIHGISSYAPGVKLARFDASVLTVRPAANGEWEALILEKLEFEKDGKKIFSLWITRDGWRKTDAGWRIAYSIEAGSEWWADGSRRPPAAPRTGRAGSLKPGSRTCPGPSGYADRSYSRSGFPPARPRSR